MAVDREDVPDYYEVIARPMDLDTMRIKVDQGLYATKDEFRGDVLLIQRNAREYNPCGPQVRRLSTPRVLSIKGGEGGSALILILTCPFMHPGHAREGHRVGGVQHGGPRGLHVLQLPPQHRLRPLPEVSEEVDWGRR